MEPPTNRTGRLAALIYLAMGITAPFSLVYMPARLFVAGNPAATARHIVASESLYRIWVVAELAGPIGSARIRSSAEWRTVPAVRDGRVLVVDTSLVGRPSVRLGEAAVALARLLHPGVRP